ncbi:MAG: glutathione S-transferase family protein [Gammaproteobacteria bacterium]|nr:glutathione S-transferase family protein [Gammaproteobacteria bacterium]
MDIARLKLYHYPSTRSARVKWLLHELLGDDFDVEVVSLYDGVQYQADYLRKNPNHAVPTLEITLASGETMHMIESGAMISLLADAFPDKGLAPPAGEFSAARADYLQMLHFGASWMDMMLWQIRIHTHILPEEERDARTVTRYEKKFADEVEPQLLTRLESSDNICGDTFTAADCVMGHNVAWARRYGLCTARTFRQYLSRLSKRPAFISAFADAHEFTLEVPDGRPVKEHFTG